jgi:hypothetical protein
MMVSLWLEMHLGILGIEMFKEREYLPQTESDSKSFELELEQFCVDFFVDEQVRRNSLDIDGVQRQLLFPSLLLDVKLMILPDLLLELLFQCGHAPRVGVDRVLDIF